MSNYPDPSDPQIPGNGMPQYPGQGVNPYGMPNGFGPDPTGKNWMGITALVCGCLIFLCGLVSSRGSRRSSSARWA